MKGPIMKFVLGDLTRLLVVFIRGGIRALLGDCRPLDPQNDDPED